MTINKTFLKFIACLQILLFHLWVNVSNLEIENFLIKTAYIGVDIFFLVSAYSLADKKIEYKSFILNRFKNVYLKFVIFALFASIYKSWSIKKLLRVIFLLDLFKSGGGSFLWFLPAIMIFYLLYPLFINNNNKYKGIIVIVLTLVLGFVISNYTKLGSLMIIINRIPVFILGYYLKKTNLSNKTIIEIIILLLGLFLAYKFGYKVRLNKPIKDLYYIVLIPLVLGICLLSRFIKDIKLIKPISSITLETYAMQMIVGYDIASFMHKNISITLLANILTLALVLIISYLAKVLIDKLYKLLKLA